MSKGTKLTSFFDARRREVFLQKWEHLKTRAGEGRVKLNLSMPLLNRSLQALPDAVSEAYKVMCEDSSKITRSKLDTYLEGMTIECFVTDESKGAIVSATGTMLKKFQLEVVGEGEKRELNLLFVAYVPANITLRDYAWEHLHSTFFLESTYSQSEMVFGEQEPEDEEDEDESQPSEPVNKADVLDFQESDPEPAFAGASSTEVDIPW